MLTLNDLRKVAARSGARDIGNVEIDVILTHLLQLFTDAGVTEHVAFKGGTCCVRWCLGRAGGSRPISISRAAPTSKSMT
jgi:predicted nucleotidyltransferase component of viral defense system